MSLCLGIAVVIAFFALLWKKNIDIFIAYVQINLGIGLFSHGFYPWLWLWLCMVPLHGISAEAEFLDEIQTKVLRVFPPSFSQSPLQLCHEIFVYFFKLTLPFTVTTVQLLYTVKEKGGNPDRKPYPLSLWFKKSIQKPKVWELSRLWPETSMK